MLRQETPEYRWQASSAAAEADGLPRVFTKVEGVDPGMPENEAALKLLYPQQPDAGDSRSPAAQ